MCAMVRPPDGPHARPRHGTTERAWRQLCRGPAPRPVLPFCGKDSTGGHSVGGAASPCSFPSAVWVRTLWPLTAEWGGQHDSRRLARFWGTVLGHMLRRRPGESPRRAAWRRTRWQVTAGLLVPGFVTHFYCFCWFSLNICSRINFGASTPLRFDKQSAPCYQEEKGQAPWAGRRGRPGSRVWRSPGLRWEQPGRRGRRCLSHVPGCSSNPGLPGQPLREREAQLRPRRAGPLPLLRLSASGDRSDLCCGRPRVDKCAQDSRRPAATPPACRAHGRGSHWSVLYPGLARCHGNREPGNCP